MTSHSDVPEKNLFIDIETTSGRSCTPGRDTIIEIAIVDDKGKTIINTLLNPERDVGESKKYIGITDDMLRNKRTLRDLWPMLEAVVTGCHVIMYNADRDRRFFPKSLSAAGHISCAMKRFAPIYGQYSAYHGDYTYQSLKTATEYIGYNWGGASRHRALADALACRAVWQWMEDRDDFNVAAPASRTTPQLVSVNTDCQS